MTRKPRDRLKRLQRLQKLGVRRGAKHIPTPPPKPRPTEPPINTEAVPLHFLNYEDDLQHSVSIEAVIPGVIIENAQGQYFNFETRYPLTSQYGHQLLANLLDIPMGTVAAITNEEAWLDLSWADALFIDLETTGLEIAAGTVAFLIGLGYLDGNDFVVRQIFMRDFNEESALLHDLHDFCDRFRAVVSFNGKTFDLPLLENRFVMARLFPDLLDVPHFDLLHPARRIWRRRLENCRLATLEADLLGIERTQADIPGYFIPSLYRKYLVDQDARPMAGIFYHNELDIVSLAALATRLGQHFSLLEQPNPAAHFHPLDILSVGLWQQRLGDSTTAETILNLALKQALPPDLQALAKTELAYLLKRQGRQAEAEALWQELVLGPNLDEARAKKGFLISECLPNVQGFQRLGPNALLALEELAKYYEWQRKDFASALTCIDYALQRLAEGPQGWETEHTTAAWAHRRGRVQGKLDRT